ncbi:uncharacterized protein LOC106659612 [Trichogramma pretiosum]|uniref:uncharacterized protein LOC106659612 n=1 Tax=Trichogramma pretiosum TaxID=7493 RepID=UPI000C71B501|nr:uncharacterized protein LOC106659612 [Trichogramma pretiosum]
MANFCSTSTVKLIGDGLQVLNSSGFMSHWFRSQNQSDGSEKRNNSAKRLSRKPTVYDELEEHIYGVMQVVKPALELKELLEIGTRGPTSSSISGSKSAEKSSRYQDRQYSPDEKFRYFTPQKGSYGSGPSNYLDASQRNSSPIEKKPLNMHSHSRKKLDREFEQEVYPSNNHKYPNDSSCSSDEDIFCYNCKTAKALVQLPCKQYLCIRCNAKIQHHAECKQCQKLLSYEMPGKPKKIQGMCIWQPRLINTCARGFFIPVQADITMPRKAKKQKLADPIDFIDLTQDSPCRINSTVRISNRDSTETLSNDDVIMVVDDTANATCRNPFYSKTKNSGLEKTICLTDSLSDLSSDNELKASTDVDSNKQHLTCPVCLEDLTNENIKTMSTPCGHVYCMECLKAVTETNKKCSLCQRKITFSKCIRLHI